MTELIEEFIVVGLSPRWRPIDENTGLETLFPLRTGYGHLAFFEMPPTQYTAR